MAAPDADAYGAQMALFNDLLVGAWQPDGVIWEAALKEGFSLDARVEPVDGPAANAVYRVIDPDRAQSFYICLDAELRTETPAALGLNRDDLFICRDAALSDELAANLALQCRLKVL